METVNVIVNELFRSVAIQVSEHKEEVIVSVNQALAGLSAYQLAVIDGFIGSKAEWLASLKGIDGENGLDGEDGTPDKHYSHNQSIPSDTWLIHHNLSKIPSVTITDNEGMEYEGSVTHTDNNNLVLTFSAPISGFAELN